ncbi:MAG: hypothetical protein IPM56_05915 [Ignavibacteriales bacterium]|nr:MAG: hypothetical protein IPM56_05915 [Ignavibacteriales bacterium]
MKKLIILPSLFIVLISCKGFAQGSAGETAKFEYRSLVDMPTAGILEKGFVGITTDVLPEGVVVSKMEVGVFTNISFGISYGGANIIGAGSPRWYKLPGVNLRVRVLNESTTIPAITLGFDSQGKGEYFSDDNRYAIKSPGFFGAVSKNFDLLGYMSIHGTVNYSLENKDGDNYLNFFAGIEKTLGPVFSLVADYNFSLNDNSNIYYGKGNGYLNIGVRWSVGEGFTLGFDLRDLLDNKKWKPSSADRSLRIEYIKSIF